jgi:hypothetical protein
LESELWTEFERVCPGAPAKHTDDHEQENEAIHFWLIHGISILSGIESKLNGQKSAASFELQAGQIRQRAHLQVAASIGSFQTKKKVT